MSIETDAHTTDDGCVAVSLRTFSPDGKPRKFGRVLRDDAYSDDVMRTRCRIVARMGFMAAGCAERGIPASTPNAKTVADSHADEIAAFADAIWDHLPRNRAGAHA